LTEQELSTPHGDAEFTAEDSAMTRGNNLHWETEMNSKMLSADLTRGKDAHFMSECTGGHEPVRGNDYIYTLPITAAQSDHHEVVNNTAATLPANLPYDPLKWNAIAMYVDPKSKTTTTLYGNDTAMQAVHARDAHDVSPAYRPGSELALVTWAQRDDPHWFGARIADAPQSVEFVQVTASAQKGSYGQFALPGVNEIQPTPSTAALGTNFILGLAPSRLP
jgi:hypothetical protein